MGRSLLLGRPAIGGGSDKQQTLIDAGMKLPVDSEGCHGQSYLCQRMRRLRRLNGMLELRSCAGHEGLGGFRISSRRVERTGAHQFDEAIGEACTIKSKTHQG
jgi:hypothetical protein